MCKAMKYIIPFCFLLSVYNGQAQTQQKPNIILIYIDDLGYSDAGCYGKEFGQNFIETPNIDKLAIQGLKFTDAYAAAPLCSPSRAGLLTGKSPARLGFEFVTNYGANWYQWDNPKWIARFNGKKLLPPPYTVNLPLEEVTIAEILKKQGYHTAMAGKWHVSSHYKVYNGWNPAFSPDKQGFDWTADTFGAWGGGTQSDEDKIIKQKATEGVFPTDELTEKCISYIKSAKSPFFLFESHYYVHTPIDVNLKWLISKYQQKAPKGMPLKQIRYAAFVETMDHYVGQLLDAIDDAGISNNTVVVLTSDNGGIPGLAFNRPFRGSKWNLYEAGVRIPMIVRWPGVIKESTVCHEPVIQTDFMQTFYEIAGGSKSKKVAPDGMSILPLLKSNGKPDNGIYKNRTLTWHFPYYHPEGDDYAKALLEIGVEDKGISQTKPQSSIRKNNLKLVYFYEDEHTELYDLANDPSEQKDLSKTMQAEAVRLKDELLNELKSAKARFPRPNITSK